MKSYFTNRKTDRVVERAASDIRNLAGLYCSPAASRKIDSLCDKITSRVKRSIRAGGYHPNADENPNPGECRGQKKAILAYLRTGARLTGIEALERFGTMKLATRISELRADGHDEIQVETITLASGKRVARYYIKPEDLAR